MAALLGSRLLTSPWPSSLSRRSILGRKELQTLRTCLSLLVTRASNRTSLGLFPCPCDGALHTYITRVIRGVRRSRKQTVSSLLQQPETNKQNSGALCFQKTLRHRQGLRERASILPSSSPEPDPPAQFEASRSFDHLTLPIRPSISKAPSPTCSRASKI